MGLKCKIMGHKYKPEHNERCTSRMPSHLHPFMGDHYIGCSDWSIEARKYLWGYNGDKPVYKIRDNPVYVPVIRGSCLRCGEKA